MIKYLFILIGLLPLAANADTAIGRLFSTPSERANLDYLRQTTRAKVLEVEAGDNKEDVPAAPADISMQGYVKRTDGQKSTVWINGAPMQENTSTSDVQVGKLSPKGNLVPIVIPGTGKVVGLKAGQVYVPDTGKVEEINAHAKTQAKAKNEDTDITNTVDEASDVKSNINNKVLDTHR